MPINKIYGAAGQMCTYHFSIFFELGSECSLFLLEAKTSASTIWHELITSNETDNDGEITIEIGKIKVGTAMDFRFGIYAIDALQNVRAVITNYSTGESRQICPEDPEESVSVKKNDSWTCETLEYEMF